MMKQTGRARCWVVSLAMLGLAAALLAARPQAALAEADVTSWADPIAIATGLPQAARPALAYTPDGVEHALWESQGKLYYATQAPGGEWAPARRIAYGMSPALAVDDTGQLHALFTNEFMGNYEIYHISLSAGGWSLPVNVSHTTGLSAYPTLAAGRGHALIAAWMDNSPGYWTIYTGTWQGDYWSSQPVPNARGQAPALATSPGGSVYLAWQDRVPTLDNPTGTFDIFVSEHNGAAWSLPVNISDSPNADSIGASEATMGDGLARLTWVEDGREVRYCYGYQMVWSVPRTVARATAVARGPRIAAGHGTLYIAWDEGDLVRATAAAPETSLWPKPTVVAALNGDLRDVFLTVSPTRGVAMGWVQTARPGDVGVYESERMPRLQPRVWLPLVGHE